MLLVHHIVKMSQFFYVLQYCEIDVIFCDICCSSSASRPYKAF